MQAYTELHSGYILDDEVVGGSETDNPLERLRRLKSQSEYVHSSILSNKLDSLKKG